MNEGCVVTKNNVPVGIDYLRSPIYELTSNLVLSKKNG